MPQITEHFSLEELTRSDKALALGIDNTPTEDVLCNLKVLANGLELVRELLGNPLRINSGFRCSALNKAVGGAKSSAHMFGFAADFTCAAYGSPLDIVNKIVASGIRFDKCIQEGRWVHISFDPQCRGILLTAHFDSNGKATYSQGV